ncbi:MAG TPA: hypothetical protein VJS39_05265 [Gemmatimonadaceae bacterium]|nr:hypothetical protein [Gemmatimonadaceae bacterium]
MLAGRAVLLALILTSVACGGSFFALNETRVIGNIETGGNQQVIQAPATAQYGQAFDVTVTTFGDSCVQAAGADVATNGATITITPYDVHRDGTCLDYNAPYPRSVKVQFKVVGTDTLRVKGRSDRGDIITTDRLVEITPAVILD